MSWLQRRFNKPSLNGKEWVILLYARLKNGRIMPWQCPSVRLSVCPSVRPSVRVFRTFLQHALRYQFETWHIHSVGGTTCRVWVASQLGHFDLVYSQKYVKPIFCNHGLINQDKFFKFGTQVACCILLDISSVFMWKILFSEFWRLFLCVMDFSKFSGLFFYMYWDISLKLGIYMQ